MRLILLLFFEITIVFSKSSNIICSKGFCENYKDLIGCEKLDLECRAQNATHNGNIFPSMTPCSCCEVCVKNLKKGEHCSVGEIGSPFPSGICGPSLYCTENEEDETEFPTCQPMLESSKCFSDQQEFDEKRQSGELGAFMQRPECDHEGNYRPVICNPGQTCFCVDNDGNRIFGEVFHTENIQLTMKCECARLAAKVKEVIGSKNPLFSMKCDEQGSYDPLQCIDNLCLCVDARSGAPLTNARNISKGISELPCFDKDIHENAYYLRECERYKMEQIVEVDQLEKDGWNILEYDYDLCGINGWFYRVQKNDTHKFCVNNDGSIMEGYVVEIDSYDADDMNCNCAKTRQLLLSEKSFEVPKCCPNGNFPKYTCRRGECYCIDENGSQITVEVLEDDIELLDCYDQDSC